MVRSQLPLGRVVGVVGGAGGARLAGSLALSCALLAPAPARAFLLALAPGEEATPLWERALVVFDPLSESQTVVAQAAVRGAPSSFAALVPVPKGVEIGYTTTSIWRELNAQVGARVVYEQRLSLRPFFWVARALSERRGGARARAPQPGVWRSKHTGIYATESALHEWLISKGLTLSAPTMTTLKDIYAQGLSVAALWVKPNPGPDDLHEETWTSTWVISAPSTAPHYWVARPRAPHALLDLGEAPTALTLIMLTEWPTRLAKSGSRRALSWDALDAGGGALGAEALEGGRVVAYKEVSREDVARLNDKLRGAPWSFRRGGGLTRFEASPAAGVWRASFERSLEPPRVEAAAEVRERAHELAVPLEPALLALYGLWWLWFRYAQREEG
ncbi:MAG: DUF2330 domain-containing protein [Deltaproteobacteria bacterium]|nr:DUF2330 domain-containing protein [Deltaproteobacteria bacterium]